MNSHQAKFQHYFPILLDIVMERLSTKKAAAKLNTSSYLIEKLIKQHFPNFHTLRRNNQIRIFKNTDLIYKDNNQPANQLAPTPSLENLKCLTDYDVAPEYANCYITMDLQTLATQSVTSKTEPIVHRSLGTVKAIGHSTPVVNEHHDSIGVLILAHVDMDFSSLDFLTALQFLNKGFAKYFINQQSYLITIESDTMTFYAREVECLLYLLVGLPVKQIASHMKLSPRSVEGIINRQKDKLGAATQKQLLQTLVDSEFMRFI